jgi:hypothetical protein
VSVNAEDFERFKTDLVAKFDKEYDGQVISWIEFKNLVW